MFFKIFVFAVALIGSATAVGCPTCAGIDNCYGPNPTTVKEECESAKSLAEVKIMTAVYPNLESKLLQNGKYQCFELQLVSANLQMFRKGCLPKSDPLLCSNEHNLGDFVGINCTSYTAGSTSLHRNMQFAFVGALFVVIKRLIN
ncbi:uncharacterized protein LOC129758369 [Uranotaenia lowii]|uniref:uncharacterized protein LOC129758369 n=1 Tax=Uranotaenia lowii TaxID=190385 RepID=UPI00247A02A9|nr:uncharacterized protein LOC129758369 [Uranotaenia lowii]